MKFLKQIISTENNLANDYDIDGFLAKRKEFIEKVNAIMVEKSDYHVIQGKKSLGKGGAEKIASIFGWTAAFAKDEDVVGSFKLDGFIAFKCTLSKAGQFVGEGRGGSLLAKNQGDPNKTIKMAQKSAFIDAVLRASGLSDFFTQDLEDMNPAQVLDRPTTQNPAPSMANGRNVSMSATDKQKGFIKSLMKANHLTKLSEAGFEDGELTVDYAKEIIDKLIKMRDEREEKEPELPTITIEESDLP
jgi:hypothetical protein